MHKRAVLLESLFLIRIGNRDPGQHFLAQQCLVGASTEPFAFSRIRTIAAATCFSVATVCFFGSGSPLLTVFNSFIPLATFLLKKQDSPTPQNSITKSATAKTT
jgi:hypothetical protein